MPTLITKRLTLKPVRASDIDALHAMFTEPGVRKFLWDDVVIPKKQTEEVVAENQRLFETKGFGLWGARLSQSDPLIGFCGFWFFREPPVLELLYGLSTKFRSCGYATEMARRMIEFGFDDLGFSHISASTDVPNHASIAVLENCGMRQTDRTTVDGLDTVFYSINREGVAGGNAGEIR